MKENGQVIKIFNPSIIQCDEHLSNRNEIEAVFQQNLIESRLQVKSTILKKA